MSSILNHENYPKKKQLFSCDICGFTTMRRNNLTKHLLTPKHKTAFSNYQTTTESSKKEIVSFHCNKCNYTTLFKNNWNKHLSTTKHTKGAKNKSKEQKSTFYCCKHCNIEYSSLHGLMVHQNKCTVGKADIALIEQNAILLENNRELMENNRELMENTKELTKQIIDICSTMKSTNITN